MSPRIKNFDPDEALDRAVDLFWEKGYEQTSMQDLVEHMEINRFSIYDTFGSKHRLFVLACERYQQQIIESLLSSLNQGKSGLAGVKRFFARLEKLYADGEMNRGCLMVNTIAEKAFADSELRGCTQVFLVRLEESLFAALTSARKAEEIKPDLRVRDTAQLLVGLINGINIVNKAYRDPQRVKRMIRTALSMLTP